VGDRNTGEPLKKANRTGEGDLESWGVNLAAGRAKEKSHVPRKKKTGISSPSRKKGLFRPRKGGGVFHFPGKNKRLYRCWSPMSADQEKK